MFSTHIFKKQIDSSFLCLCSGLPVPSFLSCKRGLFAVSYVRVETVKKSMLGRLPGEMKEFLRKFSHMDILNDILHFIKSNTMKREVGGLPLSLIQMFWICVYVIRTKVCFIVCFIM